MAFYQPEEKLILCKRCYRATREKFMNKTADKYNQWLFKLCIFCAKKVMEAENPLEATQLKIKLEKKIHFNFDHEYDTDCIDYLEEKDVCESESESESENVSECEHEHVSVVSLVCDLGHTHDYGVCDKCGEKVDI